MGSNFAMTFEDTVKKIFGRPKTPIYFANYYDFSDKHAFKSILLTMCIYELNYNPDKYNEEEVEILRNYESLAYKNNSDHSSNIKFLNFLYNH